MIKNIVFDIGGVMADFDVEVYLKHLGFNAEDVEKYKNHHSDEPLILDEVSSNDTAE